MRVERAEDIALVVGGEEQPRDDQVLLAQADERVGEAALEEIAVGLVVQEPQVGRARPSAAVAGAGEETEALAVEHLAVAAGTVLQLAQIERASIRKREGFVATQEIVEGGAGVELVGPACLGAAIVDAGERIDWLLRHLDHQRRRALIGARSLEAVLELQPRQVT